MRFWKGGVNMIKTTFDAEQFDISITGTDEIIIAELMASIPTVTFAVVEKLGLHETTIREIVNEIIKDLEEQFL